MVEVDIVATPILAWLCDLPFSTVRYPDEAKRNHLSILARLAATRCVVTLDRSLVVSARGSNKFSNARSSSISY
jgi:hypothetical protein